jgi:hypothetical protein
MVQDILGEPVELTESELDEVGGGTDRGGFRVSSSPVQINYSVNEQSAGNNNNNGSGNQAIVFW